MREQIHGGDIYRNQNVMDFSVNSNPLGVPEAVIKVIREKTDTIAHYPDMECEELRKAIGRYEQMSPEMILCGNGAAELLYAATLAVRPNKALLLAPTFSEYEKALDVVNANVTYYKLMRENGYLVQENILDQIVLELDMLFFCK